MAPHCVQVLITVTFCAADGSRGEAAGQPNFSAAGSEGQGKGTECGFEICNQVRQREMRSWISQRGTIVFAREWHAVGGGHCQKTLAMELRDGRTGDFAMGVSSLRVHGSRYAGET
jgi:hypothetical protein